MDRRLRYFVSLSALLGALILTHPAMAKAALWDAPANSQTAPIQRKSYGILVNNKNGLVTVQEKDGKFLFAQVITTSNLKVDIATISKKGFIQITLRDEHNKKLWETRMGDGGPSNFGFNWAKSTDESKGIDLSVTPRDATGEDEEAQQAKGTIVVAADGLPNYADFRSDDGNGMHVERSGNSFVMSKYENGKRVNMGSMTIDSINNKVTGDFGGKTFSASGKENGDLVLNDGTRTTKVSTITKDGITYIDLDLGDRHIFIEGTNYNVNSTDGNLTITLKSAGK